MRVSRSFDDLKVLFDVSMNVGAGEIHGLIGPNGIGKTTLLRIMAGLTDPTAGEVRILGGDPKTTSIRRRIGWIPGGDRTFYLRLSGIENLVFFGRMYGLSARKAKAFGKDLLEVVGLADAADRPTGVYSKGMLKRLAVARALISEPRVLLCDETTHDLDLEGAESIRSLFRDLRRQGLSIVWATQRLDELTSFADSVSVLSEAGVAYTGSLAGLVEQIAWRTFSVELAAEVSDRVLGVLDGLGARYAMDSGVIQLEVDDAHPLGRVIATLSEAGYEVLTINETGSHVEAAYRHVLNLEEEKG